MGSALLILASAFFRSGAPMNQLGLFLCFSLLAQAPTPGETQPLQKSAFFAFVDRDYIFTIELVKPGVPLLNFVSTTNEEARIYARDIRLALENRKVAAKLLTVETGDSQYPMSIASIAVHPRSSFAVRINGDFGNASQFYGATLRIGNEDFQLVPLSSFDFEALVLKVNRLNLGSPDFRDDWRVLRLEPLGNRSPARKRERGK
jgi:hypothetical protein